MAEWVVKEWDGTRSNSKVKLWPCECSGCGNTKHLSKSNIERNQGGCRACSRRTKSPDSLAKQCWHSFLANARVRKYEVEIDYDEWYRIGQLPCRYCGTVGSNLREFQDEDRHFQFRYNGIDRIDSNGNYCTGNIVPCCWRCNAAKNTLSHDEFVEHIARIYNHLTAG